MNNLIKEESRGKVNMGWLQSSHSFSFGHYYDAQRMGFGKLRVINDDYVAPLTGFSTHGHQNMEIITVILDGELSHKDSQGNQEVIRAGEVQVMSAGQGIRHSEMNQHKSLTTNLLQIWIMPNVENTEPSYQQHNFNWQQKKGIYPIVISREEQRSDSDSLTIKQNASLTIYNIGPNEDIKIELKRNEGAYVFLIKGTINVDGVELKERDAIEVIKESEFKIRNTEEAQYLVIKTIL